jgi:hypothetical protein
MPLWLLELSILAVATVTLALPVCYQSLAAADTGVGGKISITGGAGARGGDVSVRSGAGSAGAGGSVLLEAGMGSGSSVGGSVSVSAGAFSGDGGVLSLHGGSGSSAGGVVVDGGESSSGLGGSVRVTGAELLLASSSGKVWCRVVVHRFQRVAIVW